MKVIEADHTRLYEIPGAPQPARKPVDIDTSHTGFSRLRSFRLYRFNAGSVIDGHAEEDEVFVVVTSGSVEMKIGWENPSVDAVGVYTLASPGHEGGAPFVVYLPPHSIYQLTPHTAADVAYARATPQKGARPAVIHADSFDEREGVTTLLDERTHAEKLRLKIMRITAQDKEIALNPREGSDPFCETLVHMQGSPEGAVGCIADEQVSLPMQSWQTAAIAPGERAMLRVAKGTDALLLMVLAA